MPVGAATPAGARRSGARAAALTDADGSAARGTGADCVIAGMDWSTRATSRRDGARAAARTGADGGVAIADGGVAIIGGATAADSPVPRTAAPGERPSWR